MVLFIAMDYEFNLKMISFKLHVVLQEGMMADGIESIAEKIQNLLALFIKKNSALINTFKVESVSISTYMLLY